MSQLDNPTSNNGSNPFIMDDLWNFYVAPKSMLTGLTAPSQLTGTTTVSRFVVVIVLL